MNNIKNKILIFGFTTLLFGCSQSATSVFKKDPIYAQNVQYSKVIKSIEGQNINAIFNITYLNSVDSDKWNNGKQNFLIGSYTFDNKNDFQLTLNNQKQTSSKIVLKSDPMYKNIAFLNNWAEYKIVSFDQVNYKTDNDLLVIEYTHPKYNTITASFVKE